MNRAARIGELQMHADEIGLAVSAQEIAKAADAIDKLAGDRDGCISLGGSSVKDWLRLRFASKHGGRIDDTDHVTAILHFWPWDRDKYGPQPTGSCGTNIDTMRSPTWRLREANPVNRTAMRVAGRKGKQKK